MNDKLRNIKQDCPRYLIGNEGEANNNFVTRKISVGSTGISKKVEEYYSQCRRGIEIDGDLTK